jgi:hypothetical protein
VTVDTYLGILFSKDAAGRHIVIIFDDQMRGLLETIHMKLSPNMSERIFTIQMVTIDFSSIAIYDEIVCGLISTNVISQ